MVSRCMFVRPSIVRSSVRPSVCLSVCRFRMISRVNINGFSPNLVCSLILRKSGLGLLMGKFRQILTVLSARDTLIFSFSDDNLSKCQGILINLAHVLILRRSGLGLLMGKSHQILTELSARDTIMAGYYFLRFFFFFFFFFQQLNLR